MLEAADIGITRRQGDRPTVFQHLMDGTFGLLHGYRFLVQSSGVSVAFRRFKETAQDVFHLGGGVIADLGAHVFDLIHALLGDYDSLFAVSRIAYPQRPSAADPTRLEKVEAEDCVKIIAGMQNGAIGTIEATKTATGTEDELRFELHGSTGAIRFNSMQPHQLGIYEAGLSDQPLGGMKGWTAVDCGQRYPETQFPGPKFSIGWMRAHVACLFNFLSHVSRGVPAEPAFEQGLYVQQIIERVRESVKRREWVRV